MANHAEDDPELDSWLSDLYINAKVGWAANFDRSRSMLIRMVLP
jgi:hypothetical protein